MSEDKKKEIDERVLEESLNGTDLELAEKEEAIAKRKDFENNIKNMWGHSIKGMEAKRAAMSALATSTGMYARIPLVCKGEKCPYAETCSLLSYDLAPVGEACPDEAALIEMSHIGYDRDFDIQRSSFTDRNLIATIIEYDVLIKRVKTLISKEQDPVNLVIAGVNEVTGEEYTHPEISKYVEALDKLVRKRNELYQLMMATRRDKKNENNDNRSMVEIIDEAINASFVVEEKPDDIKKLT